VAFGISPHLAFYFAIGDELLVMGLIKKWKSSPQVVQGMPLKTVLKVVARNQFKVDVQCYGRLVYLVCAGIMNSIYGGCETFFNTKDIESAEIKQAPLFILGHWRSGTTHLHNLLSLDENFSYPSAYQASFPTHFIFSQIGGVIFDFLSPRKRPMDNMEFSSDVPHEDEFAIAASSSVSPYMKVLFPVTGDHPYSFLDPETLPREAVERWKIEFLHFLKKLTLSEGNRLLLKSPPHTGRIRILLELFPQAQFVHIVRNPYDVYLSTHKLWRDSFAHCHLQAPDPQAIDKIILDWYTELFDLFERDRRLIPQGALYEIRFEDLEEKPLGTMAGIYDSLNLTGFGKTELKLKRYLESLKGYEKNDHTLGAEDREKIYSLWKRTFDNYGYVF
jgi:omega-hydroxy-beta-dihydromenaquinone-9 sulfotransferase